MFIGDDQDAATIAATVPKPPEMVAAEDRLQVLRAEERALYEERRAATAELQHFYLRTQNVTKERLAELELNRSKLVERMSELQSEQRKCLHILDQHRPAYAAAVKAKLLPMRFKLARRVLDAIAELEIAAVGLDESAAEIKRAGTTPKQFMPLLFLGPLAASANAIAMESEQATKIQSAA